MLLPLESDFILTYKLTETIQHIFFIYSLLFRRGDIRVFGHLCFRRHFYSPRGGPVDVPRGFGEEGNMANLNWERCENILGNKATKNNLNQLFLGIKKLGTSLKVIWGKREHNQIFEGNKGPPSWEGLSYSKTRMAEISTLIISQI